MFQAAQSRMTCPQIKPPRHARSMHRSSRAAAIAQLAGAHRTVMPSAVGISRVARILLQDDYDFTQQRLDGETVFLRVNFNVPRSGEGEVLDWSRVDSVLPTIRVLQQKGARIVVGSHLGGSHVHFKNEAVKVDYSLKIVEERLSRAFGKAFQGVTESPTGPDTSQRIAALAPGEVMLLFKRSTVSAGLLFASKAIVSGMTTEAAAYRAFETAPIRGCLLVTFHFKSQSRGTAWPYM